MKKAAAYIETSLEVKRINSKKKYAVKRTRNESIRKKNTMTKTRNDEKLSCIEYNVV